MNVGEKFSPGDVVDINIDESLIGHGVVESKLQSSVSGGLYFVLIMTAECTGREFNGITKTMHEVMKPGTTCFLADTWMAHAKV